MVNEFAKTNSAPSTCVRMLHRMDDSLYDVQTAADIFNKTNTSLLGIGGKESGHILNKSPAAYGLSYD
jgi:hypothetical protein